MNGLAPVRGPLVWVIAFAIVLVFLGFETGWGDGVRLPVPAPAASKPKPVDVALMPEYRIAGGLDARKETVERVLFNPTRRPAPPATADASGANAKLDKGQYVLTGTTIDGPVAAAVLKEVKTGKSHVVRKGEKIGDLVVADVTQDKVRLALGGQFEELNLTIAAGPKTTLQPAAAAAPVPGQLPYANEAARLQALRAAEEAARTHPGGAEPGSSGVPARRRVSGPADERRRALTQGDALPAPPPRASPSAADPGYLEQYRRALEAQRP